MMRTKRLQLRNWILFAVTGLTISCTGVEGPAVPDVLDSGEAVEVGCGPIVVRLAERETLLPNGAFGMKYFTDMGVANLSRDAAVRMLVTAASATYLVEGPDMRHLEKARAVLRHGGPRAFDNGYVGVGGVYRHHDGDLFAFYHGEDRRDMPRLVSAIPGFCASVGLAISRDDGENWEKLGPVLTSWKPRNWKAFARHNGRGAGWPDAVVDQTGNYLYLYYLEYSEESGRRGQVHLARADISEEAPLPGRFRKYDGQRFSEPALGEGRGYPVFSVYGRSGAVVMKPAVMRIDSLERYVMIAAVNQPKEHPDFYAPPWRAGQTSGLYVTSSRDGIHWEPPCKLISDRGYPEMSKSISWEPGVLQDHAADTRGWLIYGYSHAWGPRIFGDTPHYMVGRRFSIEAAP